MENIIFEDLFPITEKDKDGKKFNRVSRVFGKSENFQVDLVLDINSDIYPVEPQDKLTIVIARSLSIDGSVLENEGYYDSTRTKSLADDYEYVMYGKCYKFEDAKKANKVQAFISFGGLLMCLEGDVKCLQEMDVGKNFYLLIRKAAAN